MSVDEPDAPNAHGTAEGADADGEGVLHDAPPSDPAAVLAMIAAQRESTRRSVEPSGSLLFGTWGIAWLIGYLILYFTFDEVAGRSVTWGFIVFGLCLIGALVITAVHITRRVSGVRGVSAAEGAMYGWSWVIAFVTASMLFGGLARLDASADVMAITTNGVSALIVAVMYMVGGALWHEWRMYALGAWVAIVAGAAALVAPPGTYLVMALAGGGGFLVAAIGDPLMTRFRTGRAEP